MASGDSGQLRLAELVAAFSLGTDLGLGQPMEHVLRSWRIAAGLGDRIGLDESERAALYYVALLAWVGCVADGYEVATWFGDDIAFRSDGYEVDLAGLPMLGFMLRHVGAGAPALHRLRLASTFIATRGHAVQRGLTAHCVSTAHLAERFRLGPDVCGPLTQMFARWDGKGVPASLRGDEIAMSIRLFHVADVVEVHYHRHGIDAALEIARDRRGTQFDPDIVDEFCRHAHDLLPATNEETDWIALIDAEAGLRTRLTEPEIDNALEAVADFTDLRSPYFAGHSRGVADLAAAAAHETGSPNPRSCSPDAPAWSTTSAVTAFRRRSGTNPDRSPPPSANAFACTPTTPSACWRGPRCSPGWERSPPHTTNASTAPATTGPTAARRSRWPGG